MQVGGVRNVLVGARPDDALLTWMVADRPCGDPPSSEVAVSEGTNVAWLGRAARPGERWATGIGDDPDVVARLVAHIADSFDIDGVTVSENAFPSLPPHLRAPYPGHWCFWTRPPHASELGHGRARELEPADPRIATLLEHSDSAHVFPGDDRVVQWVGVAHESELVSVAARVREPSGAAHLVSVCTDPRFRGNGLAQDCCELLVASAVAEGAPIVVLEMYAANEAGRALYSRLGFREQGRYFSGLLHPSPE